MKLHSLAWVPLVLIITVCGVRANDKIKWETDFEKALAKANEDGTYMFLDFTGSDWCIWCMVFDKGILSKREFAEFANQNFTCVKVDFPRRKKLPARITAKNLELQKKYNIRGFPQVILLNSQGTMVGRTGFKRVSPAEYVEHLKDIIGRANFKPRKPQPEPDDAAAKNNDASVEASDPSEESAANKEGATAPNGSVATDNGSAEPETSNGDTAESKD